MPSTLTEPRSAYTYHPINAGTEIRLLDLNPDGGGDVSVPIQCSLNTAARNPRGRAYHAISYTWGETTLNHHLICDGATLAVTANCHQVLLDVRKNLHTRSAVRPLWIDAVCIDQSNVAERSGQVAVMGQIFRDAALTYVWLGADEGGRGWELLREGVRSVEFFDSFRHGSDRLGAICDGHAEYGNDDTWSGVGDDDGEEIIAGLDDHADFDNERSEEVLRSLREFVEVDGEKLHGLAYHIGTELAGTSDPKVGLACELWSALDKSDVRRGLVLRLLGSVPTLWSPPFLKFQCGEDASARVASLLCEAFDNIDPRKALARRIWLCSRPNGIPRPIWLPPGGLQNSPAERLDDYTAWLSGPWHTFFTRPWFTRQWVVQEVLLSKELTLILGGNLFPWRLVSEASGMLLMAAGCRPPVEPVGMYESEEDEANFQRAGKRPLVGAALVKHVEEIRPLVVRDVETCWPVLWPKSQTSMESEHLQQEKQRADVTLRVHTTGDPMLAADRLSALLENSAGLACRDPRDKVFAMVGLFRGEMPVGLQVDYNKPTRDVFVDLAFTLLGVGNLSSLSLAVLAGDDCSRTFPSWAVDWETYSTERRRTFMKRFIAASSAFNRLKGTAFEIKRRGDAVGLRGRVQPDPIQETTELYPDGPSTRRIRMGGAAGGWGLATGGARAGDLLCEFVGCNFAFVLRRRSPDGYRLVAQARIGSKLFTSVAPGVEDIWIY